jgi:hypothetical protein
LRVRTANLAPSRPAGWAKTGPKPTKFAHNAASEQTVGGGAVCTPVSRDAKFACTGQSPRFPQNRRVPSPIPISAKPAVCATGRASRQHHTDQDIPIIPRSCCYSHPTCGRPVTNQSATRHYFSTIEPLCCWQLSLAFLGVARIARSATAAVTGPFAQSRKS